MRGKQKRGSRDYSSCCLSFGIACIAGQLSAAEVPRRCPFNQLRKRGCALSAPRSQGSQNICTPLLQTYSSNKTLVSNSKDCEAHHCLFCLLCFVSSQKIRDYGMHRVRAEVEAATCLWMAAKFCWFRTELNWQTEQSWKKSGWKTVHSTVWSL